jgi:lysozyme
MRTSQEARTLIKSFEGCILVAYRDTGGVLTIGYGHTGADVKEGLTITQQRAEELFNTDIVFFDNMLSKLLERNNVTLTQNQFDATASFVYNIGVTKFQSSTLWRKMKVNPNDTTIPNEFRRWVHDSKGNKLPGLVRRREQEAKLYTTK